MSLSVYMLEQAEQWDGVVRSFEKFDTYWLSGYVKAFYYHGDGIPLLFLYEDENTRGINVVMKRDIAEDKRFVGLVPKNQFFDFATPYGYGGWLLEGKMTDELFTKYKLWCQKNSIVSELIRFHPMNKNHIECNDYYDVTKLGKVVHMDLTSPDVIWGNITSTSHNKIRKAIKNNIKIYNGHYPEIFETFQDIYNATMYRDHAEAYYYFRKDFFDSVLNDLPSNSQVFYAVKDGIIISASIFLMANKRMNYHLSGSLREYRKFSSMNLLLYTAAMWGYTNGYTSLYLGGGVGSGDDGVLKFKKSFYKGELNSFYIGKKVYNANMYDKLITLRGDSISNRTFFPLYRG